MYPLKRFRVNSSRKIKILLRNKFKILSYPVGVDLHGNEYYDNGNFVEYLR